MDTFALMSIAVCLMISNLILLLTMCELIKHLKAISFYQVNIDSDLNDILEQMQYEFKNKEK